ncbi:Hypothetical predicted protein [Prunus dulcis]|uniref:Uncharacterized protein n=1 Tax=Prunus dulcis TaxID=3755 RepID=A0A5E4GMD5_PRUDU|nr:hypothetical protein L3X38_002140 [Prunus dulcis]VVA40816.1 Hypothetical predicted protein [Prunus dulcis]
MSQDYNARQLNSSGFSTNDGSTLESKLPSNLPAPPDGYPSTNYAPPPPHNYGYFYNYHLQAQSAPAPAAPQGYYYSAPPPNYGYGCYTNHPPQPVPEHPLLIISSSSPRSNMAQAHLTTYARRDSKHEEEEQGKRE